METVTLTMSQALVAFLNKQYISIDGRRHKFFKGVMGIFGHGNVTGIGQALEQMHEEHAKDGFLFVQGKNEQGMANAAIAFAKQQNRLQTFACTSSIGPGALNMVTAAGTATVNRIPVLFLPGDTFASRQPDPVLQQIEYPLDYTITANDAFKPVSKYWDRIVRPEQLMSAAIQAMRVLTDPADTGAVTLCLPQDVQCEAYDYPLDFFAERVYVIDRRPAAASAIERAASVLRGKRKPVLICGGGVHYSQAVDELRKFAETFGIPVVETQAGKSAMAWDHPLAMGGGGVTGTLAANRLLREADAVIAVGTRLADFTTESKTAFRNPDVEFVAINICQADAIKLNAAAITADAREGLTALGEALRRDGYSAGYEAGELLRLKWEWDAEVDRLYTIERSDGLAQTRALGVINGFVGDSDVIVCAAGSLPGDLHRLWRVREPDTYHMEYGFSCMGYEVSGALGVKLAHPERNVYSLVGDGSYLMLHSELVTSLQENRKITVLLFDNHGFQCIHNLQRGHGSSGYGNEFRMRETEAGRLDGSFMPIDFAAHARSLGARAYTAASAEQLEEALRLAQRETVSTLIHIHVLPGTNTDGYDSWWHVGVAEVSESERVRRSYEGLRSKLGTARKY
ncbi:3D-(3,5/4)-trihydroxycyclohexane-1,2-dione acylhydrolase (decyclizing) [Cohnella panacarvi]|uniref:3D-(3,5/4)-trihydroxycyclohexane-1,2-dione acylhydrolase (decyclizing) n=1 Tax=Cohnella panacarvi TaxID=400776 RepID=UPI000479CCC6|nr:3D-(3,5/4)-trihydroxycyclohexane-1,2-dione acylhydrolase (decyclizing) [Cohnella panacarvi]